MAKTDMLKLMLTHPNEFRVLVQYWIHHEQKRDITSPSEFKTSGYDRPSMRRCWELLDMTSRSFGAVIKELDGDLARLICLFYLVLRGLDTIEDDMTLADDVKQPLLRTFHEKTVTPGWTFDGCGPNEKDRQLLVEYDKVVYELNLLQPQFREVIVDICRKMATGMADYAHHAHLAGVLGLDSREDFDLYCHYVAGLVGEGLSRLYAASGKEASYMGDQLALSNAMGLMLQKTNILRDFREDVDAGRLFWPREIWHDEYGFKNPQDMYATDPESERKALWALSAMTVDSLRHATDSLDYLAMLKNQTVFNFCAIPQTMAIATLALCFMNPQVFHRCVKIRKAEAAKLIMRSTNPRDVAYLFRDYARVIHAKAVPADPNFLRISVACSMIEQWCEKNYPSFVVLGQPGSKGASLDPADARTRIMHRETALERAVVQRRKLAGLKLDGPDAAAAAAAGQSEISQTELFLYAGSIFGVLIAVTLGAMWVLIRVYGPE